MASPTMSLKTRELIGLDAFSQRREVFGKHDTVFLPSPNSPSCFTPTEFAQITERSNVSNFRRTPAYSSMRETRKDDIRTELGFRARKMSDNFTSDSVDYRHSMTERTRRISKLRQEFLTSNLHEPSNVDPFTRAGTRASMPAKSPGGSYKLPPTNVFKFPFPEPYGTPPPTRKLLSTSEIDGEIKENVDPDDQTTPPKRQSLPSDNKVTDPHKMFTELMKRYSPQPKPVNMTLPPTKPRVIAALVKQSSVDYSDDKLEVDEEKLEIVETKLEIKEDSDKGEEAVTSVNKEHVKDDQNSEDFGASPSKNQVEVLSGDTQNIINIGMKAGESSQQKTNGRIHDSSDDSNETDDHLRNIPKVMREDSHATKNVDTDDSIPSLLEKIEKTPENSEGAKEHKKIKRKRSFLDKLFNRNKDKYKI